MKNSIRHTWNIGKKIKTKTGKTEFNALSRGIIMEDFEKIKEKPYCLDKVWERTETLMMKHKISQTDMVKLCQKKGYSVQQPEISKLKSKRCKITLYQAMAFADVLGVSVDYLVNGGANENTIRFSLDNRFVTQADEREFRGILGKYYTLFHSTAEMEDKWLEGRLILSKSSEGICRAEFTLWTGEKNSAGNNIKKKYNGQVVISREKEAMYCILMNDLISEMCFISFRFRIFQTKDMACRIGLVLTVSSGEDRTPIVHKIFLSRKKIDKKLREVMIPVLRFGNKDMFISRKKLENLRGKYPEWENELDKIFKQQTDEYYIVSDAVQEALRLNVKERYNLQGLVKESMDMPFTVALTKEEDSYAYWMQQEDNCL